jgi:NADH dehydrogenase
MKMRILITGATGALGGRLVQKLIRDSKHRVRILVRRQIADTYEDLDIEVFSGDLTQPDNLIRASKDIDAIIHLAAITHAHKHSLYHEINHGGTANLIRAANFTGVRRFIFLSTKTASYHRGAYAKSKILAEESLIRSELDWTIIRPAEIYGMASNHGIQKIIEIVRKGYPLPIVGRGSYTLTPVFVDDVIAGIVSTIDNPKAIRKIYVLQGPKEYTFKKLVKVLEIQLKKKSLKVYLPVFLAKLLAYFLYVLRSDNLYRDQIDRLLSSTFHDADNSFDDLGIKPKALEETIKFIQAE